MTKAWIEGENIFVTEDNNLIIPFPTAEVPPGTVPQDLKVVNGKLVLKSREEKLNELKQQRLQQVKGYVYGLLSQTDWVCTKLYSLSLEGASVEHIEAEKQKYENVLAYRRAVREWCDQMEQRIQSAVSEEELLGLEISFDSYIGSDSAGIREG